MAANICHKKAVYIKGEFNLKVHQKKRRARQAIWYCEENQQPTNQKEPIISYLYLSLQKRYVIIYLVLYDLSLRKISRRLNRHHAAFNVRALIPSMPIFIPDRECSFVYFDEKTPFLFNRMPFQFSILSIHCRPVPARA